MPMLCLFLMLDALWHYILMLVNLLFALGSLIVVFPFPAPSLDISSPSLSLDRAICPVQCPLSTEKGIIIDIWLLLAA